MQFTEGQLKPAARRRSPTTRRRWLTRRRSRASEPAAQAVAERAVPAAEQLTEGQIKPAARGPSLKNVRNVIRCMWMPKTPCNKLCMLAQVDLEDSETVPASAWTGLVTLVELRTSCLNECCGIRKCILQCRPGHLVAIPLCRPRWQPTLQACGEGNADDINGHVFQAEPKMRRS